MSSLVFDGTAHTLTLYDAQDQQIGQWHANNVVDHKATLKFVPNGEYDLIDKSRPFRHGGAADTANGPYGRFGIIRLDEFSADGHVHDGVGVHSGRANKGGPDHATMGCIRTTDAAMAAITGHMPTDPLTTITVQNNHIQPNILKKPGDHHKPALQSPSAPLNPTGPVAYA
jgi:hypothetical protein